ncbi:MAG: hypothetical protein ABI595_00785 [Actinomycetota bacterium]
MKSRRTLMVAAVLAIGLTACGGSGGSRTETSPSGTSSPSSPSTQPAGGSGQTPVPTESPVPPEDHPPGDIPDNAAFVPYRSTAGGFTVSVPEGWARTTSKGSVSFTDKLNTVVVSWQPAAAAPTVASAKADEIPQLRQSARAFALVDVTSGSLPAGPFVLVRYQANSDPNPVTGKQYRLDVLRYELFRNGGERVITLLSPVGADNVDPWNAVTQSFAWS